ncbi:hypothetical protein K7432_002933 [Basidiobolus ranarum]|uniref:HNH domain-containing protein n=1 Tax=Basidiobolus ranarum TaxID=34480 RepID=A0ABR2X0R2_9FUNG
MTTTVSKNSRWRADRGRVKKDSENRIIDDKLARGPRGFVLCRYCQKETNNEYRTFCNPVCIHNFKLQTQPCYVRLKLFERDKGICMECGINAHGIFEGAASCSNLEIRLRYFGGLDDKWRLKVKKPLSDFTQHFTPGMFWEAAHIIGVYKGGGACSLDNYRTLCVPCHHKETKRENAERAALRKIEKQNLPKDQTFLHKYWNHKKIGASEPPKQVHDKDYSSLLPRTTESTSNLDNRLDENTPKPPPGLIIPQNKLNIKSSSTFKGVVHQVVSSGQLSGNSRSTVISGNISISGTQSVPDDAKRKKYWNEAVRTMLAYEEQEKGPNTDWDSIKLRYPDVFSPRRKASPSDAASLSEKKYIEIDLTLTPDEPAISNSF